MKDTTFFLQNINNYFRETGQSLVALDLSQTSQEIGTTREKEGKVKHWTCWTSGHLLSVRMALGRYAVCNGISI